MTILGMVIPSWVKVALRAAPYVALAVLIFLLQAAHRDSDRWEAKFNAEKGQFALLEAGYRQKSAEARAKDSEHARAVAQADGNNRKESDDDYQTQLAADRARLAAHVDRLRQGTAATDQRGIGGAHMSGPPGTAAIDHGPGATAIVDADDADICTENSRRVLNIKETWWPKVEAVKR